jgi:hypothetical protein
LKTVFRQGSVAGTLDELVRNGQLPVPHHIKIDVDGLEHRVIEGMLETISRPQLKTVLVEINFDNPKNLAIIDALADLGWRFSWEQLRTHRKVKLSVEKIKQYQERGVGGLNYIFFKDDYYENYFSELFRRYTPGEPLETQAALSSAQSVS